MKISNICGCRVNNILDDNKGTFVSGALLLSFYSSICEYISYESDESDENI